MKPIAIITALLLSACSSETVTQGIIGAAPYIYAAGSTN